MKNIFTRPKMFKGLIGLVGVGVLGSVLSCSPRFERDFGVNASSNTTDFIYDFTD